MKFLIDILWQIQIKKNKAYGIFYTYFHILRSVHYSENFSQFFSTLNDEKF